MSMAEVHEVSGAELDKAAEHLRWFVGVLDKTGQRSEIGHSAKKLADAWMERVQNRQRLRDDTEQLRAEIADLKAENESLREQLAAALTKPEPITSSDMESLVSESLPVEPQAIETPPEEPVHVPLWAIDMMNKGR